MDAKCTKCNEDLSYFEFSDAEVHILTLDPTAGEERGPKVDLVLECPHCGQHYNTFVDMRDLIPLEE